jgi:hypothetical protein
MQQIELVVGQGEPPVPKACSEFGTTFAMSVIDALIDTLGIVEDGKELDDCDAGMGFFGKAKSILQYPGPMQYAVCPVPGQGVLIQYGVDDGFEVEHNIK